MHFEMNEIVWALIGGILIGLSVTVMLLFKGRVTWISGILYGFVSFQKNEWSWRGMFLLGLLAGGVLLKIFYPESLVNNLGSTTPAIIVAGFLVGFGTLLGNGCTSGHGVCGISRLSIRSILATITFMFMGIMATYVMRVLFWSQS